MTMARPALPQREGQDVAVERAQPTPVTTIRTFVSALHDSFIQDDEIDDALDLVLGKESALLTPEELDEVTPRIRKHLRQLVQIALQRVAGDWSTELTEVAARAQRLDAAPTPADFPSARGHARRLALTTQDVLEVLAVEEDTARADGRWSA